MVKLDLYHKKNLDFRHDGVSLTFRVSQSLFSSHQIDVGTLRLLKTMQYLTFEQDAKILDIGCGYGTIGLTLAKRYPDSLVHMVDRDALAINYVQQNTTLNDLNNCISYGSLGFEKVVERDFDLIISNIPGKAGENVITALLEDACLFLKPNGVVAVVVVSPLEGLVASVLEQSGIEVLHHSVYKGYVVFHYRFTSTYPIKPSIQKLEDGLYHRASVALSLDEFDIDIETAYGLPEFDSLDYQTDFLIKVLVALAPKTVRNVVVYNPGQGYIPVILWRMLNPEKLTLVSRDLLSVRYAGQNLLKNGYPGERIVQHHQVTWDLKQNDTQPSTDPQVDFVVGILRDDEGPEVSAHIVKQAVDHLTVGNYLFVAGGSTPITRLLKSLQTDKRLLLIKRRKHQGKSVGIWRVR